ncbi:MAG: acetoacetate decarboxylase family protein [Ruminococcaceae bacterium]|nr:acetoacetate decarboxylase family protein [Oscillospiraceae bacterium]
MSKYSFVSTPEELQASLKSTDLFNFEGYFAAWRSNPKVLQNMLPPPLQLDGDIVRIYMVKIHNPSGMPWYRESNLMIKCKMGDTSGWFVVAMYIEGPGAEMGAYYGRATNMPKKLCESFTVDRMGPLGRAALSRGGEELFKMKVDINGKYNNPALAEPFFKEFVPGQKANNDTFLVQYGRGFADGKPLYTGGRMMIGDCHLDIKKWEPATIDSLILGETPNDPWAEVEVVEPIGAAYTVFDLFITNMRDLGEIDTIEALRRTHKQRFDVGAYGHYIEVL